MKNVLFLTAALLVGCASPKEANKSVERWFRGNLHTHSYWSDGDEFPEMIMEWYKTNGYDFVALSDHNTLAQGEKWKLIPKGGIYRDAFSAYLGKYGEDWVEYKEDTGRISVRLKTFEEYAPRFQEKGEFLIIQSEEITNTFEGKPLHLNATNVRELTGPQEGSSVAEVLQKSIDAVAQQRERTGQPMIVHINHPNFYYAIAPEDMMALEGERFFEVFNGHPLVNNYGDSAHLGTEQLWDAVNLSYIAQGKPLLYGVATDDSHNYHLFGDAYSNSGRGWVMVRAGSLDAASLIDAMEAGNFYATTGVVLQDLSFNGSELRVAVAGEDGVSYRIEFVGALEGDTETRILHQETGMQAGFKLTEEIQFVRARIVSDKLKLNPFQEGDYETAWTQPVRYGRTE